MAIRFILSASTEPSSATGDYVAVLESFGQNEEPAGSIEERSRKKPSFVTGSEFNQCNNTSDM